MFPRAERNKAFAEVFDDAWLVAGKGDGFTIPSTKPNKRIDFIWIFEGCPLQADLHLGARYYRIRSSACGGRIAHHGMITAGLMWRPD